MEIMRKSGHLYVVAGDGQTEVMSPLTSGEPKVVVSSPLGFAGATIYFEEIAFPATLAGMTSYVGHPATKALLEALGATFTPGRWVGPEVGESYLAVPLATNPRPEGVTVEAAVEDTAGLKAILCTRIA